MKRILVPTDFSRNAYSALFYATRLFQNDPCQFYILHAFEVNNPLLTSRLDTGKGALLYKELSANSKAGLAETLHAIVRDSEAQNHRFETISVSKSLTETLTKTIATKNIDMVVMGTKGVTNAKTLFMGSNTVKALQTINTVPVLVIPDEFDFKKPAQIALPTSLERSYSEKEMKSIIEIAALYQSRIRIFHIHKQEALDEVQDTNYWSLVSYLSDYTTSIHWIPKSGSKTNRINEFINLFEIDLLVMFNYKHSLIEAITHEPVIKKIGFHPVVPFLVVPGNS